ncbi:MAG: hypothetical protein ACFB11_09330 [Paracoccaceae bacterium]
MCPGKNANVSVAAFLLAAMAGDFVSVSERMPISVDVSNKAEKRFTESVKILEHAFEPDNPQDRLAALNSVAGTLVRQIVKR